MPSTPPWRVRPLRRAPYKRVVLVDVPWTPQTGKKKVYTTTVERPSFFSFSGSEALWCIPFFPDLWCIPFSLISQKNGTLHSFFCSVTSGSGDRPRKEGATVVVYTLFSWPKFVQVIGTEPNAQKKDAAFWLTIVSFLLTVELLYLQLTTLAFLLTVGAFLLIILAFLLTVEDFVLAMGECV